MRVGSPAAFPWRHGLGVWSGSTEREVGLSNHIGAMPLCTLRQHNRDEAFAAGTVDVSIASRFPFASVHLAA
jgi:hypothetical protein